MFIIILKNFFLFNFIYGVLKLNKIYNKKYLISVKRNLKFNFKNLNFKYFFLTNILKKKIKLKLLNFYVFKIFLINRNLKDFFKFEIFLKKNIIDFKYFLIKRISQKIYNYIINFKYSNYIFKIVIFMI